MASKVFPKPLPFLWPKSAIFPTLFITWLKIWYPIYDLGLNGVEKSKVRMGKGGGRRTSVQKFDTLFMIKTAAKWQKIATQYMTKTAEKPYPLWPHIPIYLYTPLYTYIPIYLPSLGFRHTSQISCHANNWMRETDAAWQFCLVEIAVCWISLKQ